jgi:hypothetical protein
MPDSTTVTSRGVARPFVPVGQSHSPRRFDAPFWAFLGVILIALWLSFSGFVVREIAWAYPANYDQTKYLGIAYSAFETLLRTGFRGAAEHLSRGAYENGILLHFEALILFTFFGASRLTALTINFAHLVVYVGVFAGAVKHLTGSRLMGLLAYGLAFGTGAFWFGNMVDYRLDFLASCMFGIFVSAVMVSGIFRSRTGSVVAGAAAGLMMLSRFLSSLYIAGIYLLLASYFVGKLVLRRLTVEDRIRLRHLVGSGLLAVAVAFPAIWLSRTAIYNYYVVQQGKEIAIRAIEFPAGSIVEALLYYPKSLLVGHVGLTLALEALIVLAAAGAVRLLPGNRRVSNAPTPLPVREAGLFLFICAFVVMATLNANTTRSPVVIGILVPVFSWSVLLTFFAWLGPLMARGDRRAHRACAGAALIALTLGVGAQISHFSSHRAFMLNRMDTAEIVALYDRMGETAERSGWTTPTVASDSMRDYLVAGAPTAVYYERHAALVNFVGTLGATGSVNALPRDIMLTQLDQSDFLVLTHHRDATEPPYPVVEAIESIRAEMEGHARDRMTHLHTYRIFGRQVDLYARPAGGAR